MSRSLALKVCCLAEHGTVGGFEVGEFSESGTQKPDNIHARFKGADA